MKNDLLGKGIYSFSDAHKLTRLPATSIRRWIKGYNFSYKGSKYHSRPLWDIDIKPIDNCWSLSFKDLIELKFVEAFRKHGLNLRIIRLALIHARERFKIDHPFCTHKFLTDGKAIFLEIQHETGEKTLEEFIRRQIVFKSIMKPFLKELEFENDIIKRWWPLTNKKQIVLDPERSFGQPIVNREGILSKILANAVKINGSIEIVSKWYNVTKSSIKDAIEFENEFAA